MNCLIATPSRASTTSAKPACGSGQGLHETAKRKVTLQTASVPGKWLKTGHFRGIALRVSRAVSCNAGVTDPPRQSDYAVAQHQADHGKRKHHQAEIAPVIVAGKRADADAQNGDRQHDPIAPAEQRNWEGIASSSATTPIRIEIRLNMCLICITHLRDARGRTRTGRLRGSRALLTLRQKHNRREEAA